MSVPQLEFVQIEQSDKVAIITLNRPQKANALHTPFWFEIKSAFEWVKRENSVRVVILTAEGKHFCAGIDISIMQEFMQGATAKDVGRNAEFIYNKVVEFQSCFTAIEQCQKPVITAVHGSCIGGGVDMIAACDMRFCTEDASFSIKEIDLGIVADVGTLQRLPHLIGWGALHELAYTGRNFDATEAEKLRLVNKVFKDKAELLIQVKALAQQIAKKPPTTVRGIKQVLLYNRDHTVADGLNYVAKLNSMLFQGTDIRTAAQAFLFKQETVFDD